MWKEEMIDGQTKLLKILSIQLWGKLQICIVELRSIGNG